MGRLHSTRVGTIGTEDIENKWIWLSWGVIGVWIILIGNLVVRIMIYDVCIWEYMGIK